MEDTNIFKIAFLNYPSIKINFASKSFKITGLFLAIIILIATPRRNSHFFSNIIVKYFGEENIISIFLLFLIIMILSMIYSIYEQSKHQLFMEIDEEQIVITHKLNEKILNANYLYKKNITDIKIYYKIIPRKIFSNKIYILSIKTDENNSQDFIIPKQIITKILNRLKKNNYTKTIDTQNITNI